MTTIYSKTNNSNSVNTSKKNLMQFTGLTPSQKDKLLKGGLGLAAVAGAGLLITSLSGFDNKPEETPLLLHEKAPVAESVNDNMSFSEAFASARQEVGAGGIFTWQGKEFNTYYKEEWNSLSPEQKNEYIASLGDGVGQEYLEHNELAATPVEVPTDFEIAQNVTNDMSFSKAFETAREECGSDGLFVWHGNTYNTFTKEEWANFNDSDKAEIASNIQNDTDWNNIIVNDTDEANELVNENVEILNDSVENNNTSDIIVDEPVELLVLDNNGNEVELVDLNDDVDNVSDIVLIDDPKNEAEILESSESFASNITDDLDSDINLDDFEIDENLA